VGKIDTRSIKRRWSGPDLADRFQVGFCPEGDVVTVAWSGSCRTRLPSTVPSGQSADTVHKIGATSRLESSTSTTRCYAPPSSWLLTPSSSPPPVSKEPPLAKPEVRVGLFFSPKSRKTADPRLTHRTSPLTRAGIAAAEAIIGFIRGRSECISRLKERPVETTMGRRGQST
jgi:hypothetical protein